MSNSETVEFLKAAIGIKLGEKNYTSSLPQPPPPALPCPSFYIKTSKLN